MAFFRAAAASRFMTPASVSSSSGQTPPSLIGQESFPSVANGKESLGANGQESCDFPSANSESGQNSFLLPASLTTQEKDEEEEKRTFQEKANQETNNNKEQIAK